MLLQRSKSHLMCIFEEDFIDCFNCLAVEFAPLAPQIWGEQLNGV